jgi:cation-transporting ATPase 13A3/4/5
MAPVRYFLSFVIGISTNNSSSSVVQERDSADLVPGDIVNLSSSELALMPADLLLLSGDAIVNESMLTGESVPISKSPIQYADLLKWRDEGEIKGQVAKGFLYAGTRVIRIRGVTQSSFEDAPALGLVVRTGNNMSLYHSN